MHKLEIIARARTRLQEERDLIQIQRMQLRKEIRANAIRKHIIAALTPVTDRSKPIKAIKAKKSEIGYFTLADDQYRGAALDKDHLQKTLRRVGEEALSKGYKHLVLLNLGDSVEGSHRASSKVTADAIPQAIEYGKAIAEFLNKLSEQIKVTYYMVTADNHGEVRSVGKAGETPQNNVLQVIEQIIDISSKNNPNLTVHAAHTFYNVTIPGGYKVALAHGNYAIHKKLDKFKNLCGDVKVIFNGHLHHNYWCQEIGFDMVIAPSSKGYVVDYEINGGYAQVDHKTNQGFRKAQFQEVKFDTDGRIKAVELYNI